MVDFMNVPLSQVVPSMTEGQTFRRSLFTRESIADMAKSLKQDGMLQPIVVRIVPTAQVEGHATMPGSDDFNAAETVYEVIAGERRLAGAIKAKLRTVPVAVHPYDSNVDAMQVAENMQRQNSDPITEAISIVSMNKAGKSLQDIGKAVGKTKAWASNRARLVLLTDDARKAVIAGDLNTTFAEAKFSRLDADAQATELAERTFVGLSSRDASKAFTARYKVEEGKAIRKDEADAQADADAAAEKQDAEGDPQTNERFDVDYAMAHDSVQRVVGECKDMDLREVCEVMAENQIAANAAIVLIRESFNANYEHAAQVFPECAKLKAAITAARVQAEQEAAAEGDEGDDAETDSDGDQTPPTGSDETSPAQQTREEAADAKSDEGIRQTATNNAKRFQENQVGWTTYFNENHLHMTDEDFEACFKLSVSVAKRLSEIRDERNAAAK